jgi:hypothetical protein
MKNVVVDTECRTEGEALELFHEIVSEMADELVSADEATLTIHLRDDK